MNILITGVSRGIGRELVLKFAQNPNNNIVVFSSDILRKRGSGLLGLFKSSSNDGRKSLRKRAGLPASD